MVTLNTTLDDWEPSKDTDFHQFLNEAVEDRENNKCEISLAKHIWFHENVLKYDESFYGVRLSFALSEWHELGKVYPKALQCLNDYSDQAEKKIKEGGYHCREAFHEFVSIKTELNNFRSIVKLFKWLDSNNKKSARITFSLAQPALILCGEYQLCGEYIQPEKNFNDYKLMYEEHIKLSKSPEFGGDLKEYGDKSFTNQVATLISLLWVNDRQEEAIEIADLARCVRNDPKFSKSIEQALLGIVPKPWP